MKLRLFTMIFLLAFAVLCCVVGAAEATLYSNTAIGGTISEPEVVYTIESIDSFLGDNDRGQMGVVTQYTQAQAAAAGVPAGYSGTVWKVDPLNAGDTYMGALVDFSDSNIPLEYVKSINFRVYLGSNNSTSTVTFYIPKNGGYAVTYDMTSHTDGWYDFTLSENYGWRSTAGFVKNSFLGDADGMLDKMNIGVGAVSSFYIDSIDVEYYPAAFTGDIDSTVTPNAVGSVVTMYTAEKAAAESITIPSGYTGQVWKADAISGNGKNLGPVIDFTDAEIPAADVESITFRLYLTDVPTTFYIPAVGASAWALSWSDASGTIQSGEIYGSDRVANWEALKTAATNGQWYDFVLDEKAFRAYNSFSKNLADADGNLSQINLRFAGISELYIDSVTVKLKNGATIDGEMLGAQIRNDNTPGLRFGTRIVTGSSFALDDIKYSGTSDMFYAGTLVVAKSMLDEAGMSAAQLDHSTAKIISAVDVEAENIYDSAYQSDSALYTAVITEIPDSSAEIVARGYIRYTPDGGITYKYFYFDPITRSMDSVSENIWTKD